MKTIDRDELYRLVWQKPMSHLAKEFGVSDTGMAKICRRLNVPYPPRGHWAKKAAGKQVQQTPLPSATRATRGPVQITPSQRRGLSGRRPSRSEHTQARLPKTTIAIPSSQNKLHRIVAGWIAAYQEKLQDDRRRRKTRGITWVREGQDLTARDLYRFRVTSALLFALEKEGAAISDARVHGTFTAKMSGQSLEFQVVEKMRRPTHQNEPRDNTWTAFPHHHNSGLRPTGFLKVAIKNNSLDQREWIETPAKMASELLPHVIAEVPQVIERIAERRREFDERQRRWALEHAEREERARIQRLDAERWERFRALAADWSESQRLKGILVNIKSKPDADCSITAVDEMSIHDWVRWAEAKIEATDPL